MSAAFIDKSLVAIVAVLYAVLLIKILRSSYFLRVPVFTGYIAAMVPANLLWNPNDPHAVFFWGIALISLRVCVAIEIYLIVQPSMSVAERRGLLAMLAGISVFVLWRLTGYYDQAGLMGWYKSIRQMSHTIIASALFFGTLGAFIHPPRLDRWKRNHALIGTLYFLLYAAISFVKPGKGEAWLWYTADVWFQVGICACIVLWLLFVVPKRAKAPLQIGQTVV